MSTRPALITIGTSRNDSDSAPIGGAKINTGLQKISGFLVDNFAELRKEDKTLYDDKDRFILLGGADNYDGMGGIFYYDASDSTSTENNDTVVGEDGARYKRLPISVSGSGITIVTHDNSLDGQGTPTSPLSINSNGVGTDELTNNAVTGVKMNISAFNLSAPLSASKDGNGNISIAIADFGGEGQPGKVPDPGPSGNKFLKDDGTWAIPEGVKTIPPSSSTSTAYTLQLSDVDKLKEMDNTSPITVTVPTNATAPFPIGSTLTIVQAGTGQVTISPASGVSLLAAGGGLTTTQQYSMATLIKKATDVWYVAGDLI